MSTCEVNVDTGTKNTRQPTRCKHNALFVKFNCCRRQIMPDSFRRRCRINELTGYEGILTAHNGENESYKQMKYFTAYVLV